MEKLPGFVVKLIATNRDDWNKLTGGGLKGIPIFLGQLLLAALGIVLMAAILVLGGIAAGPKGYAGLLDLF